MLQRCLRQLVLTVLLAVLAPFAGGQTVSTIRVMLHPYAADPGKLPDATLAQLQALAGKPLKLAGTTRTGGLEFALTQPFVAPTLAYCRSCAMTAAYYGAGRGAPSRYQGAGEEALCLLHGRS
jgi:hypothetical protein